MVARGEGLGERSSLINNAAGIPCDRIRVTARVPLHFPPTFLHEM